MRLRFTILATGLLVLSGCQEQPTPKPPLPARVTTPIEGPAATAPAQGVPACPPAPACVPAKVGGGPSATVSSPRATAGVRRAAHHVASSHRHGRMPPEPGAHRHYRRYTGPDLDRGAGGEESWREQTWREDGWSSSETPFDRGWRRAGELQAYGQDGAGMRVAPGPADGFEAAGRDELGYLTWPGKRP